MDYYILMLVTFYLGTGIIALLTLRNSRRINLVSAIILILLGPVSWVIYGYFLITGKLHTASFDIRKEERIKP